jgi:hypothetical protein
MAARRSGCWGGAQPRQQDGKHGGQPGQDQQDTSPAAMQWLLWPVVVGALLDAPLAVDHALPSVVHAGAWHAARGMVLGRRGLRQHPTTPHIWWTITRAAAFTRQALEGGAGGAQLAAARAHTGQAE